MVLVLDLDDTLLQTDLTWHGLLWVLKRRPWLLPRLFYAFYKKNLALTKKIVADCFRKEDLTSLPVNEFVVQYAKNWDKEVYLVTGSHQIIATAVAQHFDFIREGVGSQEINLTGKNKRDYLVERFGKNNFIYAGDCAKDLYIWQEAAHAVLVSTEPQLIEKVQAVDPHFTHIKTAKNYEIRYRAVIIFAFLLGGIFSVIGWVLRSIILS